MRNHRRTRRYGFSLIELIAVIAIAVMVMALSVATLRNRGGAAQFDRHVRAFRQFCHAARAQAAETGQDRAVIYSFNDREFRVVKPDIVPVDPEAVIQLEPPPDGYEPPPDDTPPRGFVRLAWKLPEQFSLIQDDTSLERYSDTMELFRFHVDGGAAAQGEFSLQYGNLRRVFRISPVSGRLLEEEPEQ